MTRNEWAEFTHNLRAAARKAQGPEYDADAFCQEFTHAGRGFQVYRVQRADGTQETRMSETTRNDRETAAFTLWLAADYRRTASRDRADRDFLAAAARDSVQGARVLRQRDQRSRRG